jgi:predicted DsbA family dithiol-disulfide isomerase
MPGHSQEGLSIDVVSDVVCPWCYVGKRRLEAALATLAVREPGLRPVVRWHPFQLNPGMPAAGMDRQAYVEAKFGGSARAAQVYERVRAAGASAGIAFAFDRIARQPNTLEAHRLIAWAEGRGDAEALVERLFRAFFIEGRDVGDRATLALLAGESGLDPDAARAHLDSGAGADEAEELDRRARGLGIDGVPFFIFNGRVGVAGAQEPATLLAAIEQGRAPPRDDAGIDPA